MAGELILIVDDNALNVQLLSFMLTAHGYAVCSAPDCETAWPLLETMRPRLVLIDVRLPGIDGIEFTRRLRADPRSRAIPIIVVTASAMRGDEAMARAAGCDDYVTKPVDTRQFPLLVARALDTPTRS